MITTGDKSFPETDLAALLSTSTRHHDPVFDEAIHLLESMSSVPSCHRIAAMKLVTSCQDVGAGNRESNNDVATEHLKSLYAARLAVCELDGAGAAIPPSCARVNEVPSQKKGLFAFSSKSSTASQEAFPAAMLESCLKSLELRPQWWTSYSNSRQNAVVLCQASRVEIEKEEILNLHRSAIAGVHRLSQGLRNLSRELGESESYVKRVSSNLIRDVESAVGSILSDVSSAAGRANTETAVLEKVSIECTSLTDRVLLTINRESKMPLPSLAICTKCFARPTKKQLREMKSW